MGKHQNGFTKIELLVILVLFGLSTWVLSTFVNPLDLFAKHRDEQRKNDIAALQSLAETYYMRNGQYPSSSQNYHFQALDKTEVPWGGVFLSTRLPKDPTENRWYIYIATPDGQAYRLYANVESKGANTPVNVPTGVFCGENNLPCNYGVSSRNVSP